MREMGIASMKLWAFLVLVVESGGSITVELENRTVLLILSKPVGRTSFLLGKYFGILLALAAGVVFLGEILILTLWWDSGVGLLENPVWWEKILQGAGVFELLWQDFLRENVLIVLEGMILTFLQLAVLAALCVSFSAFFPVIVTVAATTFLFILGNILGYMVGGIDNLNVGIFSASARGVAYLLPNLGYFNLQSFFSQGRLISLEYVVASTAYAVLYVSAVLFLASSLFERREIG